MSTADQQGGASTGGAPVPTPDQIVAVFGRMWAIHRQLTLAFLSGQPDPQWVMHPETGNMLIKARVDVAGTHPVRPELDGGWSAFGWKIAMNPEYGVGVVDLVWPVVENPDDLPVPPTRGMPITRRHLSLPEGAPDALL